MFCADEFSKEFLSCFSKDIKDFLQKCSCSFFPGTFAKVLKDRGLKLVAVESCTGGLISKIITDYPGSSEWFWGSFVTYDNNAKIAVGVPGSVIEQNGAVSKETVLSMAESGFNLANGAGVCVSVSGIAGPGGGSVDKPAGTVWIGIKKEVPRAFKFLFSGSREEVRKKAAFSALFLIYKEILNKNEGIDTVFFNNYI
jgi:PncC family amidohydrolase